MFKRHVAPILTLDKGGQFGEFEFISGLPMMNEVITILPTMVIWISRATLNELKADEEDLLRSNIDTPQTNEEIMKIFLENSYWKRYKHVMVKNVLSNKKDYKASKNYVLRNGKSLYKTPTQYYDFLLTNGYYVFSGSGVSFPERMNNQTNEDEKIEEDEIKTVGFGSTYKKPICMRTSKSKSRLTTSNKRFRIKRGLAKEFS